MLFETCFHEFQHFLRIFENFGHWRPGPYQGRAGAGCRVTGTRTPDGFPGIRVPGSATGLIGRHPGISGQLFSLWITIKRVEKHFFFTLKPIFVTTSVSKIPNFLIPIAKNAVFVTSYSPSNLGFFFFFTRTVPKSVTSYLHFKKFQLIPILTGINWVFLGINSEIYNLKALIIYFI